MKKLLNDSKNLLADTLRGYAAAHAKVIQQVPNTTMIERVSPKEKGKVRFMISNGSGHEPAVICWVGKGMFDLNVVGQTFASPSASQIYQGIKRMAKDGPVLMAVQNHAGDVLNAGMAMDEALEDGVDVQSVLFYDDIASAPLEQREERRGMAGMLFYAKMVGALAEQGASREKMISMFEHTRDATRTYSVALTNCTHPVSGVAMFPDLPADEIELGMGVHGEGGAGRVKLPTSCELAKLMADRLLKDGGYAPHAKLLVFVNGSGGMTMMEMSILYGDLVAYLTQLGYAVEDGKVGNYLTTQELSGASISFCAVDEEMLALWNAPCEVSSF